MDFSCQFSLTQQAVNKKRTTYSSFFKSSQDLILRPIDSSAMADTRRLSMNSARARRLGEEWTSERALFSEPRLPPAPARAAKLALCAAICWNTGNMSLIMTFSLIQTFCLKTLKVRRKRGYFPPPGSNRSYLLSSGNWGSPTATSQRLTDSQLFHTSAKSPPR